MVYGILQLINFAHSDVYMVGAFMGYYAGQYFTRSGLVQMPGYTAFFFALIWLAAFSSKQYRQNKRLEQEYAHKEVLAKSYQGYKRELESQGKTATDKEIIATLHKVLVATIAKNPSEIMDDGRSEDAPSFWTKPFICL